MNLRSFFTNRTFKRLLINNTIVSILIIVLLVAVLVTLANLQMPQRIMIDYMDKQMLRDGEGAFIIVACIGVFTIIPLYISLWITNSIMLYYFFYKILEVEKDGILNGKWWAKLVICIFCIFYLLLPVIFIWFFYINPIKWSYSINAMARKKSLIPKKIFWIMFPMFSTLILLVGLPITVLFATAPDLSKTRNRPEALTQAYTLSANKPNTIVLYFDRGMGIMWNQLLMVDYLLFKDQNTSFIQLFPEFNSYINSLSLSMVTNTANPSINYSWFMQPDFKNSNIVNPWINKKYKDLTFDELYLDSYLNYVGMLANQGYQNFAFMNPPYYGSKSYQVNADAYKLENDLKKAIDNNENIKSIVTMDVTEIVKTLGLEVTKSKTDEINFLHYFAASTNNKNIENTNNKDGISYGNNYNLKLNNNDNYINLRTSNKKGSSFIQLYFQTTHENYQYVKNDNYVNDNTNPGGINYNNVDDGNIVVSDPTPNNEVISIWYAIQKLKRILTYMKNLPANDNSRPWVKNQYDNTNIYVISDHGAPLVNKKDLYVKVLNYLINNNIMTINQKNYILNTLFNYDKMSFTFWNTTFMRKPAKYSNNNWNIKHDIKNFFNTKDLYVDSDLLPIIEADIMKQNYDWNNPNNNSYSFDETKSWYYGKVLSSDNKKDQELINNDFLSNFLFNPLENSEFLLGKRNIPLFYTNWLYIPNSKKFDIYYKYYFINKYPGGIFNVKNYFQSYKN